MATSSRTNLEAAKKLKAKTHNNEFANFSTVLLEELCRSVGLIASSDSMQKNSLNATKDLTLPNFWLIRKIEDSMFQRDKILLVACGSLLA